MQRCTLYDVRVAAVRLLGRSTLGCLTDGSPDMSTASVSLITGLLEVSNTCSTDGCLEDGLGGT